MIEIRGIGKIVAMARDIDAIGRAQSNTMRFMAEDRGQVGVDGIIGLFVSMLVIFYILAALIPPTETSVVAVTNALGNSTFTEVQNISTLPKVSYLVGLIAVIVGIIYLAWGR